MAEQARALPPPALDSCDLVGLVPGLDPATAERAVALATLVVTAALYPNPIPSPIPAPVAQVLLSVSLRVAGATTVGGGQVVSESIGGYSYRLASPPSLDAAFGLTDAERDALAPWAGSSGVYELTTGLGALGWPIDWWQRDYDNALAYFDEVMAA